MIGLLLTILLIALVLLSLVIKIIKPNIRRKWDIVICVIIPILCIIMFIAFFFETSYKRRVETHELEVMLASLNYDTQDYGYLESNEAKTIYRDSLQTYLCRIDEIATEDSLLTIFVGADTDMKERISKCKKALNEKTKWIDRLNDLSDKEYSYFRSEFSPNDIELVGCTSNGKQMMNMAIKIKPSHSEIICVLLEVQRDDKQLFSQSYTIKDGINCFVIPFDSKNDNVVRLGYISEDKIFKYINYASEQ